jgi:hypothetical protein
VQSAAGYRRRTRAKKVEDLPQVQKRSSKTPPPEGPKSTE